MKKLFIALIFIIFLIIGYYLIPQQVFNAGYSWLALPFIVLFSLTATCTLKNLKVKYKNSGSKKAFIGSIFGFGALQVCGLSAYACSTAIGFTMMATILPHSVLNIFQSYSIQIILISIFIQIWALYQLDCLNFFKKS